jgi:hypothetical protein
MKNKKMDGENACGSVQITMDSSLYFFLHAFLQWIVLYIFFTSLKNSFHYGAKGNYGLEKLSSIF